MKARERWAWIALVAVALALRLVLLADRPPHHDEAVHAHFADVLRATGEYHYDPTYHGPLFYYVTATVFTLVGEDLFTLRLYPAVAGTLLVALPLLLRRRLGSRAAWWCGASLAISPSFVYYSRFARNDVPVELFTAAALVFLQRSMRGSWRWIPWIGVAAALHAASKETFYVLLPLLVVAAAGAAVTGGVRRSLDRFRAWTAARWVPLGTAAMWFLVITVVAYTVFLTRPSDAVFPVKAVSYWYHQHTVQRVGGPAYYHLPRLLLYEFVIIGAALAWVLRRRSRMRSLEWFCLLWGLASVGMYAFLGEKVPWLEVHQLLPFVPLAGLQLGRTFSPRGRWWSRGMAGVGVAATLWSMVAVSFVYPTIDPADTHAELLVFVQTTRAEEALAREGRRLEADAPPGQTVVAAVAGEASWPLSWQWRGMRVWWKLPSSAIQPLIAVCDPSDARGVEAALGYGFDTRTVPLRAWWVETWKGVAPGEVVRWFFTRRAWSARGATEVTVFEKARENGP